MEETQEDLIEQPEEAEEEVKDKVEEKKDNKTGFGKIPPVNLKAPEW